MMEGKVWKFGDDIDTDIILPGRYLIYTDEERLSQHCMEGLDSEFPNKVDNGDFIVAGKNFGCGSSREHAAWAIHDAGYRAVVSSSFADIFKGNALNNSLLPVQVSADFLSALTSALHADPLLEVVIDLPAQTISAEGIGQETFPIVGYKKVCLMNGYSDIDYLLSDVESILDYEADSKSS